MAPTVVEPSSSAGIYVIVIRGPSLLRIATTGWHLEIEHGHGLCRTFPACDHFSDRPSRDLQRRHMPLSQDLRRDFGIWAGIMGLFHTAVGLNVHLRGRPWLYFIYQNRESHLFPLRHDQFGLANETGLFAAGLLALLLATSNDRSLRYFGTARLEKASALELRFIRAHSCPWHPLSGH